MEPFASSNDDDDDEYVPESLRVFVAQAEMKQESVLSLISNEMSGEEIEKSISEDFEATIIDLPPPSLSSASGNNLVLRSSQPDGGPEFQSTDVAMPRERARMTKKIAAGANASHLRRLLGASTSEAKQVQQKPSRRRPLANRVHGTLIAFPEHAGTFKPSRSPMSSKSCQTSSSSEDEFEARLSAPLISENETSLALPGTSTLPVPAPAPILPREESPTEKTFANPSLSMGSFDDDEVPESLRSLFQQADQALRQTQQEFLDVARGCQDTLGLLRPPAGVAKCSDHEDQKQSASVDDDKSVEFPLSLYADSGGERKSTCAGSTSFVRIKEVQNEALSDPVTELEPILVPVDQHEVDLDEASTKRKWSSIDCESVVLVPQNQFKDPCDSSSSPSPRAELDSSDTTYESVNTTTAASCTLSTDPGGQTVFSCKPLSFPEPLLQILPEEVIETNDVLGHTSVPHLLVLDTYVINADCLERGEPRLLAMDPDQDVSENVSLPQVGGSFSSRREDSAVSSVTSLSDQNPGAGTFGDDGQVRYQSLHASDAQLRSFGPVNSPFEFGTENNNEVDLAIADSPSGMSKLGKGMRALSYEVEEHDEPSAAWAESAKPLNCGAATKDDGIEELDPDCGANANATFDSEAEFVDVVASENIPSAQLNEATPVPRDGRIAPSSLSPIPLSVFDLPTPEKALQASASPQNQDGVDATRMPQCLLLDVVSDDVQVRYTPCPSDDNHSGNFMPACCSPAQASSNGSKVQPPEVQETESEESSIRKPPSIVQVPSPFKLQTPASPSSIEQMVPFEAETNTQHVPGAHRDVARLCNDDLIMSDRVSSTLTESDSDETPSILTVHSRSKVSPCDLSPSVKNLAEVQEKELDQIEERSSPNVDPAPLTTANVFSTNESCAASCDRVPLFGAFDIPKSIFSFVAFADEMLAQQQSQFLCCGQDPLATDMNVVPNDANRGENAAVSMDLERQDSMWKLFSGSGSTDPIRDIPVEAVLRSARREEVFLDSKDVGVPVHLQSLEEESGGIEESDYLTDQSGLGDFSSTDVGGQEHISNPEQMHDVQVVGRAIDSERIDDHDTTTVTESDFVNHDEHVDGQTINVECSGQQHVEILTESDMTSQDSSCSTCLKVTEPSGPSPQLLHTSFSLHNVQSLESSQDWNDSADGESFDDKPHSRSGSLEVPTELVKASESAGMDRELIAPTADLEMADSCLQVLKEPEILKTETANEVVLEPALHENGEVCGTSKDDTVSPCLSATKDPVRLETLVVLNHEGGDLFVTAQEPDSGLGQMTDFDSSVHLKDPREQRNQSTAQDLASEAAEVMPSSNGVDELDMLEFHPGLDLTVPSLLPSYGDAIRSARVPKAISKGLNRTLDSEVTSEKASAEIAVSTCPQPCSHAHESLVADTVISRNSPQEASGDSNDSKSNSKRLVRHSPRNWRSSNQKRAEEGRAKAIERIRQRKLKEKQSVIESREIEGFSLKAKSRQYSAQEGVARAIRRMQEFRKSEQVQTAEPRKSTGGIVKQNKPVTGQGCSRARHRCMKAHHVHENGTIEAIELSDISQRAEPSYTVKSLTRLHNNRHNRGIREPPRRSFIVAPRATRGQTARKREEHPRMLQPARSMDDPQPMEAESSSVHLQSAKTFPSYMRPTISSSAPAYKSTENDPWGYLRRDAPLAASSRVLQSMLRSKHPVVMNTGLWKWYARPLPPRILTARRK